MFTAKQAREKTEYGIATNLVKVYESIEKEANKGESYVYVDQDLLTPDGIEDLKKKGYGITKPGTQYRIER